MDKFYKVVSVITIYYSCTAVQLYSSYNCTIDLNLVVWSTNLSEDEIRILRHLDNIIDF